MTRILLALGLLTAVVAAAQISVVKDGNATSYTVPVGGKTQAGTRLPIPLTGDGGAIPTVNYGSLTSAPAETISTVVGNVTACTAVGGASCSVIYPSTDWGAVPNLSIAITNLGATVIDNVLLEWSPIADGGGFELWDSTMFASLAASTTKSVAISGNSRRFLRIESRAAADGGPVHVTVTGNQN